jgi:hypothetical protein
MADVVGAGLRRASALLAALGVVAIRGDTLLSLKTVITDLTNLTPEQFERAVEEELKGLGSPIPEFRTASARRVPGRKFTYCSLRHLPYRPTAVRMRWQRRSPFHPESPSLEPSEQPQEASRRSCIVPERAFSATFRAHRTAPGGRFLASATSAK